MGFDVLNFSHFSRLSGYGYYLQWVVVFEFRFECENAFFELRYFHNLRVVNFAKSFQVFDVVLGVLEVRVELLVVRFDFVLQLLNEHFGFLAENWRISNL